MANRLRLASLVGMLLVGAMISPAPPASATLAVPETLFDSNPGNPVNVTDAQFEFSADPPTGATFTCTLDGTPYTPCISPVNLSDLSESSHTFKVAASNSSGTDETPASLTWRVDLTDPVTTITEKPARYSNSVSAKFTYSVSESIKKIECRLDSGIFSTCPNSSTITYNGLDAADHTFYVRATDKAGNIEHSPKEFTWTVDLTAPDTTITEAPLDLSNTDAPQFEFDTAVAESGATFECQLDSEPFAGCTSPKTYADLSDGSHTFNVRATDQASNTDLTPATKTWVIDTAIPETTLAADAPSGSVASTEASLGFTSPDGTATFECQLDSAPYAACSSRKALSDLAQGPHTFQVRARDAAGNVDATPASASWTVDTVAPTITLDTPSPAAPVGAEGVAVAFHASEAATLECSVDDAPYAACASPLTVHGVPGPHHLLVKARDAAGNQGSAKTFLWSIESTPPVTTLDSPTSAGDGQTTFTFHASEAATFQCSLDNADWSACASPAVLTGLAAGSHRFAVRAIDQVGNVDPVSAVATWTVVVSAGANPATGGGTAAGGGTGTSGAAAAALAPSAVGGVTATFPKKKTAVVSWVASSGATSYQVRLSKKNSLKKWGKWMTIGSTSATFAKLKKKGKYAVQIAAVNAVGSAPATQFRFKQMK